ncbi:MAG: PLD nuclease N-terminal domain-containing protein [Flavobacteriaceae bacterium]|jgi:hypothetical protein|nr:PLD nuclease N-terminal domain-containing protein [Flavobacteriaceae bacterium]
MSEKIPAAFLLLLMVVLIAVYIYTIIDILRSNKSGELKLLWMICVLCMPFLGTILYFWIGKKSRYQRT